MWLIRLLCCAIVFWRFLHGHTWSHDRKQTLTIGIACFSKTMSRWGIACCGRSLRLRLRLLQLQSHLDSSTKKPDQTKPQETQFERFGTKPYRFDRFLNFVPSFEFPDLSCCVPAPQLACLVVSEVSSEVRLARWHANRHGAQNLEFLEFHKFWWLFHKAFQILMRFSKPFLSNRCDENFSKGLPRNIKHMGFLPIYFVHGFHFFSCFAFKRAP